MKKIIAFGLAFSPAIAFAQIAAGAGDTNKLLNWLLDAFNVATGLLIAAAVVFFLWGVFQYVRAAGDEEAQKVGRAHILNGIIGLAVMVSVWGLVAFVTKSAGLGPNVAPEPPKLPVF